MSTHWSVTVPATISCRMPRLRSTYSMLVELNTPDDVFGSTISFGSGASSSITRPSGSPFGTKMSLRT